MREKIIQILIGNDGGIFGLSSTGAVYVYVYAINKWTLFVPSLDDETVLKGGA